MTNKIKELLNNLEESISNLKVGLDWDYDGVPDSSRDVLICYLTGEIVSGYYNGDWHTYTRIDLSPRQIICWADYNNPKVFDRDD